MTKFTFKSLILLALVLIMTSNLLAVPAITAPISFTQPDGNTLTVRLKGDEKIHWYESMDGYTLLLNQAGYLTYAQLDENGNLCPSDYIATDIEKRDDSVNSFLNTIVKRLHYSEIQRQLMFKVWEIEKKSEEEKKELRGENALIGNYKALCAFVQFPETNFRIEMSQFDALMNQLGYTENGSGSVRDFFRETSYNKFDLTITLCGVYNAPNSIAYYAGNSGWERAQELARWLAQQVAAEPNINFEDFDSDNDGMVDGFHFIFAGYGMEAVGVPGIIWSHMWSFEPPVEKNGKYISVYSCSPELLLITVFGVACYDDITTIGVICHELSHGFGAADFYDTDGADENTGYEYIGTGEWDLMAHGSWNSPDFVAGNVPAHHNMYVKTQYGWVTPTILDTPTSIIMMPNSAENPVAYRVNTTTDNEYFLLENRQHIKFDLCVPDNGLLIYRVHADIAEAEITNTVNATHPQRMYPVYSHSLYDIPDARPLTYAGVTSAATLNTYPGKRNYNNAFTDYSTPSMKSWAFNNTNKPITSIYDMDGFIWFEFMGGGCPTVTSLTVDFTENCNALLNWSNPTKTVLSSKEINATKERDEEQLIFWCDDNFVDGYGYSETYTDIYAVMRFTPEDLAEAGIITGDEITVVSFIPFQEQNFDWVINIWSGGTHPSDPGKLDYLQYVDQTVLNQQWNDITLNSPYFIDISKELWIGYRVMVPYPASPAAFDAGPRIVDKGDIICTADTVWTTLYDLTGGALNRNWNITALVTPKNLSKPTSYNIYRDATIIASNISETSFVDMDFDPTVPHTWSVTALCENGGESPPANVMNGSCFVGIKENKSTTSFSVVPNPAFSNITITSDNNFNKIEVIDLMGKTIISQHNNSNKADLNISALPKGVYFVRIITNSDTNVMKLIKQ